MQAQVQGLRVKAIQFEILARSPEANTDQIIASIRKHKHECDLFVFAEMAVPGYFIGDDWERPNFLKRCEECHERIRKESGHTAIVFGSVGIDKRYKGEDGRPRLYNAAFVFQNQKTIAAKHLDLDFWPKTLLANYREFEDTRHFYDLRRWAQDRGLAKDDWFKTISIQSLDEKISKKYQIGISICEDAWNDDYPVSPIAGLAQGTSSSENPIDLILNLSASPFTKAKAQKRERVFSAHAKKHQVPILYVNTLGIQNSAKNIFAFDGNSALYCNNAQHSAAFFEADELSFVIDQNDHVHIEPAELKGPKRAATTPSAITPSDTANAMIYSLKQILKQWNIKHVVVGASGGIDSSLSAALFTWVLGPTSVTLVNMPSRFNSKLTQDAAEELARNLGTSYIKIPIDESVRHTQDQLFVQGPFVASELVMQNIQARDRGARILAAVASALGGVFTCNANKSELTAGYATLYGDACGFLAPLADLWKHEVYALAHEMNEVYFMRPVIPKACFDLPPSAELSDTQNVEKGQGDPFHYPYHDKLFQLWVEDWHRPDLEETLELYAEGKLHMRLGVSADLIQMLFPSGQNFAQDCEKWWNLYTGLGAFKRIQTPPLITLSRRSFGVDHKETVGPESRSTHFKKVFERVAKIEKYPSHVQPLEATITEK